MGAEYAVNIKLNAPKIKSDLKGISTEISKLESRVAKLNRSTGKNPTNKQLLRVERDKLALQLKENRLEKRNLQTKVKENRLEKRNLQTKVKELQTEKSILSTRRQSTNLVPRSTGGGGRATGGGGSSAGKTGGSSALSSALISGAFPLLFGQGLLGGAAGFAGGFIGTKLGGQMGGFAGGLVATALLQTFQNTADKLNTLGAALNDPSKNIQELTTRIAFFDKSIGSSIATLQSAGLNRTAGELARITIQDRFGVRQTESIQILNKEMKKFGMLSRDLGMKLNSLVAGPLTLFFKLLNLPGKNNNLEDRTITDSIRKQEKRLQTTLPALNEARDEVKLIEERIAKEQQIVDFTRLAIEQGTELSIQEKKRAQRAQNVIVLKSGDLRIAKENLSILEKEVGNGERLVQILKIEKQLLEAKSNELRGQLELQSVQNDVTQGRASEKTLAIEQKKVNVSKIQRQLDIQKAELTSILFVGTQREIEAQEEKVRNLILEKQLTIDIAEARIRAADPMLSRIDELNREMRKLNDTQRQTVELSKVIGSSFEDSFKGIIRGTMTVQDAFRNMLNRIADFFIESAARIAANSLQQGILGLFGNALGKGSNFLTPGLGGKISAQRLAPVSGIDFTSLPKMFADGGRPPVGRASIVGERGPELFVPDRAGTIIPNNELFKKTDVINKTVEESNTFNKLIKKNNISNEEIKEGNIINKVFKKGDVINEIDLLNNIEPLLINTSADQIDNNFISKKFDNLLQKLPRFADGGEISSSQPSIIGEKGPELFVPTTSGTVIPNDEIGNVTNNIVVNVDASGSSVESDGNAQQFGEALATAIQSEIVRQKRSGGLLA